MKSKGSITVFLSLTFLIVLTLISGTLFAAKLSADRAAIAISTDEAVFSLFSCYDKDLLSRYDVFFIDGGAGSSSPAFEKHMQFLKDAIKEVLEPSHALLTGGTLLSASVSEMEITAYTTAAEQNGIIFAEQAVRYMQDTLGIQGIALLGQTLANENTVTAQENAGAAVDAQNAGSSMDALEAQAAAMNAAAGAEGGTSSGSAAQELTDNPVDTIRELQRLSLLDLVYPDPEGISDRSADGADLLTSRSLLPSLGVVETTGEADSGSGKLLFNEYLLTHCGSALAPGDAALSYELEYLLFGHTQDKENLRAAAKKLMLIRTGVNAVFLLTDPVLHASVTEWATAIAAALTQPEFEPLIETILIAAWAWAESLLDVRALFSGKKVALVKTSENWQLRLENLPALISSPDSLVRDAPAGMSYTDYLRTFLLTASASEVRMRFLAIAESAIRLGCGRPDFRLDLCLDTVGIRASFLCEGKVTCTTEKRASYRFDF